jgi:hypothetical protein
MLYDVKADMGGFIHADLDGDGVNESKVANIQIMQIEARDGDEAAQIAHAQGARAVRGVSPSERRVYEPAAEPARRGPGRPRGVA